MAQAWLENVTLGMAAFRAAGGRRTLLVNGDSVAVGVGAADQLREGFVSLLRDYLAAIYGPSASTFVRMDDAGWVKTGSWQSYHPCGIFLYTEIAGNNDTASYTATCSGFDFYYKLTSITRPFTLAVDSGAPVSVGGAYGSGNPYQKWSWSGAAGLHTLTLTAPAGGYLVMGCGLEIITSLESGLTLVNAAVSGSRVPGAPDYGQCLNGVTGLLSMVAFTLNDFYAQTDLSSYSAALGQFCASSPGSQILLALPERSQVRAVPQTSYDAACREVARVNGAVFINLHQHWGSWAQADAQGWMADETHPSTAGHARLAADIITALQSTTPLYGGRYGRARGARRRQKRG